MYAVCDDGDDDDADRVNVNVGLIKTLRGGFDTTIQMFRSFFDLYQTKGLAICKC